MILDIVLIRVILPAVFLYLILLIFIAQVIIGLFSNIEAGGEVTLREILQEIDAALGEALDRKSPLACSVIALAKADEVWLGHNEDWSAGESNTVIAIYAKPTGKPAFLSVTAAPFLAAVGINEAGLAQGVNSVSSIDCSVGVPRMFAARAVLEGTSIANALTLAAPDKRAGGYNHLLAHAGGEIGCFETSALDQYYMPSEEITYHANHYVSPRMLKFEQGAG
jgi:hypothetical protein